MYSAIVSSEGGGEGCAKLLMRTSNLIGAVLPMVLKQYHHFIQDGVLGDQCTVKPLWMEHTFRERRARVQSSGLYEALLRDL